MSKYHWECECGIKRTGHFEDEKQLEEEHKMTCAEHRKAMRLKDAT